METPVMKKVLKVVLANKATFFYIPPYVNAAYYESSGSIFLLVSTSQECNQAASPTTNPYQRYDQIVSLAFSKDAMQDQYCKVVRNEDVLIVPRNMFQILKAFVYMAMNKG